MQSVTGASALESAQVKKNGGDGDQKVMQKTDYYKRTISLNLLSMKILSQFEFQAVGDNDRVTFVKQPTILYKINFASSKHGVVDSWARRDKCLLPAI